jgi:hypothetical protein
MNVSTAKVVHALQVRNAYAEWLNEFKWTYWATFTTVYKLTMPSARRAMEGMFKEISKAGKVTIFYVIEPFDLKEGYHLHALVALEGNLKYNHIINLWQYLSGNKKLKKGKTAEGKSIWNRTDLQKYNPKLGARHYVGKYMTKAMCDYDILTNQK